MLCVFGTVIFILGGSIKKSTANLQISKKEKNVCREIKTGSANNIVFNAILAHPSHMQFLLKCQNTKVPNTQLRISYSKHNVIYWLPYFKD